MKKEKFLPFLMPLICVGLGVWAFLMADRALLMLCYLSGGLLILTGLGIAIRYLTGTPEENFANNGFVLGFVLLLLGAAAILKAEVFSKFIPFSMGFLIALNGVRQLQNAIDVFKLRLPRPWFVSIVALINLLLGIVLMVNPGFAADVLMKWIGCGLVLSGISDFITTLVILGKGHPFKKES